MNVIKFQGGLGNQLFQYAFGLYLENIVNTDVKYDSDLVHSNKNYTNRTLDITKLGIYVPFLSPVETSAYKKIPRKFWRIERKLTHLIPFFNKKKVVRNNPHIEIPLKKHVYYDGYFQRWEYVKSVLSKLNENIVYPQEILNKNKTILENIEKYDITAIHIRRDDYINVPVNFKIFEICNMEYYRGAIDYIKKVSSTQKFLIFTQDKEWAKDNFSGDEFYLFEGNTAIEDFTIMGHCKHHIIANSTFSWWAAVLNNNPSKHVIYPKKWYKKENKDFNAFIPEDWIPL